MTLLATTVSGVIVVSLVVAEVKKYVNIFDALSMGVKKDKYYKERVCEKSKLGKSICIKWFSIEKSSKQKGLYVFVYCSF